MNIQRIKELVAEAIDKETGSFDERKTKAYAAAEQLNQGFIDGSLDLVTAIPEMRHMGRAKYPFVCCKCRRRFLAGTPGLVGDGPDGRNVYGCLECF